VLFEQQPDASYLAFEARVDKTIYQGSETRVFLSTDKGLPMEVSVRNASRESAAAPVSGRVWVAWRHADTLVLPD